MVLLIVQGRSATFKATSHCFLVSVSNCLPFFCPGDRGGACLAGGLRGEVQGQAAVPGGPEEDPGGPQQRDGQIRRARGTWTRDNGRRPESGRISSQDSKKGGTYVTDDNSRNVISITFFIYVVTPARDGEVLGNMYKLLLILLEPDTALGLNSFVKLS